MRCTLSVCCDTAVVDQRNNAISIINVLDDLQGVAFPIVLPRLTYVAVFERDPSDSTVIPVKLHGIAPNGQSAFTFDMAIDFSAANRARVINEISGIVITGPGLFTLGLQDSAGVNVSEARLNIQSTGGPVLAPQQPIQTAQATPTPTTAQATPTPTTVQPSAQAHRPS